ncbi:MAG TPA: glycoside hydrolase family 3 C-terminal domain-containing protein [Acidimicrobiales bacterium]|nr:glycoside hydrolase family 3 C-terminal domain-containing protein [Acidimicrobiales bacterium]
MTAGSVWASGRVEAILAGLSIDEKASLTVGSGAWHTIPLPAAGVGRVKVTDGPTGARGDGRSGASAICFPVGVSLGASWSTDLLAQVGAALAEEARTKGAHVLLGPTVNMQRTPIGGRNFECYAEDPLLTARLAVAFVQGLQGAGIGASIKHFVGNDTELDRHEVSVEIDERTLREVSLLPFERAVAEADPWTVMAAYNRVNGETATASRRLLTGILKEEWGWPGMVVSDWGAVKDTVSTALAGCDLEMPGPVGWLGPRLADAVRAGDVPEEVLDDLARRVLHLAERAGRLDDAGEPPERADDDPGRRALARRAAIEGTVLLRNDGVLPFDRDRLERVALIGPNVSSFMVQGGGSSQVLPHGDIVGPLDALRASLGDGVEVIHEPGCTNHKFAHSVPPEQWRGGVATDRPSASSLVVAARLEDAPVAVELYDGLELDGDPARTWQADGITTTFFGRVRGLADQSSFSGRFTATYLPVATGVHSFGLSAVGRSRLFVDGVEVIDSWTDPQPGDTFYANGSAELRAGVELEEGVPVEVVAELATDPASTVQGIRVGIDPPEPADLLDRAVAAAADADVVVVVVGTTGEWETEGNDRDDIALPGRQAELVEAVAAVNDRTVVVVNAGSPVDMDWVEGVGAALQVWFGGQEMGPALADMLLGHAEPGGRLPHTIPARLADHPAASSYPGSGGRLVYEEGLLTGHRWYDARGIEPRFPFGHGLSYTTFEWGDATLSVADGSVDTPQVSVTVPLANTGDREGSEVVQLYVRPPDGAGRPQAELKAFAKATLAPGEADDVVLDLDRVAFRTWDVASGTWVVHPGTYEAIVGASSRDLRSSVSVELGG